MTYQWSKNGAAISGATSASYTTPAETTADNNAKFTVAVSNSAGSATSNAAVLTVSHFNSLAEFQYFGRELWQCDGCQQWHSERYAHQCRQFDDYCFQCDRFRRRL